MVDESWWRREGGSLGDVLALTLSDAAIGWVVWEPVSGRVHCSEVGAGLMGLGPATSSDVEAWLASIAPDDREHLDAVLHAADGASQAAAYRLHDRTGTVRFVEMRGRLARHDGVLRGSAVLLDVSEAQARVDLLRTRELRFREAFVEAPVAIALTTGEDVLLDVNRAFVELTGYDRDEVVGRDARELGFWSSPEDQQKLNAFLDGDEGSATLDLHLRTRAGRIREVLVSITRMPDGSDGGFVKVLLDVTERRGMERKLVQALRKTLRDTDWLAQRVLKELASLEGAPVRGPLVADFTRRERQVLELLARGFSNESVAGELSITPSTVRNYVSALYSKLGVESRAEAVVWAREHGLGGE